VLSYGYDAASNRTSMDDPQNLATVYTYDALNRLSTLAFNGQTPAFGGWPSLSRFLRRLGMFTRHCKATELIIISLHALGIEALSANSRTPFHYVLLLSSPCSARNRKGSRPVCHCPRKSANLVWILCCRAGGPAFRALCEGWGSSFGTEKVTRSS
jgi:hypothetical protein